MVNVVGGKCLNLQGWISDKSDVATGTPLTLFQCTSSDRGWDDHLWTFTK